ncbi:MAG: peroxiredoxin family protein [Gammaproteobacteria bacterium]|nr:peroxiredoxin family protein [Gammaproteobacteria bacterium]
MGQKKLAIIATKGTLDWAYPPLILASTAAALDYEVEIFFTFYGLQLLRKDVSGLKVSPLGNPGMPMKMPFGPEWFRGINWNIPNIIQANVPGFESLASTLMKKTIANNGVASIAELRELCQEAEVRFTACQMTVELFDFNSEEDFIDGIEYAGAAKFFEFAGESDICLYI